ncbi:MAG TPA: DnaB-like helicase C-terminal domain-containing protein [Gemmatimonadaceae bacterium]|nr:DnaB-like helicase C-terminal domain-containing protein [Gemmatimonadaceae bacterium]
MPTSRELLAGVLQRLASDDGRTLPAPDLVTTGYQSLDRLLAGGLRRGELAILGGDAGAGKTALALGIAIRAAVAGHPVLILTHESSVETCWERIVAAESGVTHVAMRTGVLPRGGADALKSAADVLRRLPITVEIAPNTPALLAERLDLGELPALVIIDGLAGLDQPPRPVAEAHAQAIRLAKRTAVEHEVAMLMTTALAADRSTVPPPRPALTEFSMLGSAASVADVVMGIYREALYDDAPDIAGAFEVHVLKHRAAVAAFTDLYIEPGAGRVEDLLES